MGVGTITDKNIGVISDKNISTITSNRISHIMSGLVFNGISNTVDFGHIFKGTPTDVSVISVAKSYTKRTNGVFEFSHGNLKGFRYRFQQDGHMWILIANDTTFQRFESNVKYTPHSQTFSGVIIKNGDYVKMFVGDNFVKYDLSLAYTLGTTIYDYRRIGSSFYPNSEFLDGGVYLFAIFNEAKPSTFIKQMYDDFNNNKDLSKYWQDINCVLWYDGDSISKDGTTWYDRSGNGHDGTINGAKVSSNFGGVI